MLVTVVFPQVMGGRTADSTTFLAHLANLAPLVCLALVVSLAWQADKGQWDCQGAQASQVPLDFKDLQALKVSVVAGEETQVCMLPCT